MTSSTRRRRALAPLAATVGLMALAAPASGAEIQALTSPGGVEAWLVEERAIPIISINIAFRGGAALDPDGKAGAANMLAGLLDEGAGPYDNVAFAERADELAARFSFSATKDQFNVSLTMLADKRDDSVELARLALVEPRFDADPVARVRKQILSGVRQAAFEPDAIASAAWMSMKFPDDPYGRPLRGDEATVEAITAEDLKALRPLLLNRSRMKVGVVGAISAEEVGPLLDRLLGDLPEEPYEPLPEASIAEVGGVRVVEFDAPQSTVLFGHRGLKRSDPDFIPAYVMNYVLGGGGFASRLMEEVREKRGLAYGVYSYLSPLDRAGLYMGGVATENARVAESISVVRAEWARMAENGISEEDLEKAKRYLTGSFALRFDSNAKIARFLVGVQLEELGIDYINRRNDLVEAVTVEDIQRVAQEVLRPDDLFIVVVGTPEGLDDAPRITR